MSFYARFARRIPASLKRHRALRSEWRHKTFWQAGAPLTRAARHAIQGLILSSPYTKLVRNLNRLRIKGNAMSERNEFNQRVIDEFRANRGKVGGQMASIPLLLLTTTGAKTGRKADQAARLHKGR
jgi:hypothetical protein